VQPEADALTLECVLRNWPEDKKEVEFEVDGELRKAPVRPTPLELHLTPRQFWFLEHGTARFHMRLPRLALEAGRAGTLLRVHSPHQQTDPLRAWHQSVRNAILIPPNLFDETDTLPPGDNIKRVSGRPSQSAYRWGGATTFFQLNEISRYWAGRELGGHPSVLDWGVGCARVLRHFWESRGLWCDDDLRVERQQLMGVDVDPVNVDWCTQNLAKHARFIQANFEPPLPLPDASIDFTYGISVMTHLTEYNQMRWLAELHSSGRSSTGRWTSRIR
jgi:hypothetical protein